MITLIRIPVIALLLACASTIAFAQAPGMYPWWDGPVAKDLGLSDEQMRQIRVTVRESRDAMIQLRAAVQAAETELKSAMNNDPVDSRKASETIEKVVAARADLMRAVSQMSLKLRLILTAAQWQELQKREPQRGMPRMQRNGGGMGRPNRKAPDSPMDRR